MCVLTRTRLGAGIVDRTIASAKDCGMASGRALVPAIATAVAASVAVATAVLVLREAVAAHAVAGATGAGATIAAVTLLLAAGVVGTRVARLADAGTLCAAAVVPWLAPVWTGWHGGPGWVRVLSSGIALLVVPILVHLLLLPAAGRLMRGRRVVVAGGYVVTGGIALVVALTRDPFRDAGCWNDCNIAGAVTPSPLVATILTSAWHALTIASGALAITWWILALVRRPRERPWTIAVTGPAALSLAAVAVHGALRMTGIRESVFDTVFTWTYVTGSMALGLAGCGVVWLATSSKRRRRAVIRLIDALEAAPPPGSLESALRSAIGDPELRVAYWLPHTARFVDSFGATVTPDPDAEAVTIRRDEEMLAVITLTRPAADALVAGIGAAARLTIDNERLLAESAAQLAEVAASRRRIVDAADRTRHGIERDLHDGAQAELVAALFDLGLAETEHPPAAALAVRGREIAAALRELSHGIYPAALDDLGLEAALRSLLDAARHPLRFEYALDARPHPDIERAVYAVVRHLLAAGSPTSITLDLDAGAGEVRLTLEGIDDGVDLLSAEDRIGAIDGILTRDEHTVTATIPAGIVSRS